MDSLGKFLLVWNPHSREGDTRETRHKSKSRCVWLGCVCEVKGIAVLMGSGSGRGLMKRCRLNTDLRKVREIHANIWTEGYGRCKGPEVGASWYV